MPCLLRRSGPLARPKLRAGAACRLKPPDQAPTTTSQVPTRRTCARPWPPTSRPAERSQPTVELAPPRRRLRPPAPTWPPSAPGRTKRASLSPPAAALLHQSRSSTWPPTPADTRTITRKPSPTRQRTISGERGGLLCYLGKYASSCCLRENELATSRQGRARQIRELTHHHSLSSIAARLVPNSSSVMRFVLRSWSSVASCSAAPGCSACWRDVGETATAIWLRISGPIRLASSLSTWETLVRSPAATSSIVLNPAPVE